MALSLNVPQGPREVEKTKSGENSPGVILVPDVDRRASEKSPTANAALAASVPKGPRPTVTVEPHVPERVRLELPSLVKHRWQLRVAMALRDAKCSARSRMANADYPPLRWYSQQLMELCGPKALQLSPSLYQLEEHRQRRPWIWKEGGHLPLMLEHCSVLLCEASQVMEAVALALEAEPSIAASMGHVREKCFRATDAKPAIHACLECSTAEEAMALAMVELSRLQGAGSALACALRREKGCMADLHKAFCDDELWQDFLLLVPFLEMTWSKLRTLSDLVFTQLEEDFKVAPAEDEGPIEGCATMFSQVDGSESFAALWAAQADPTEASDTEEAPPMVAQPSDAGSEEAMGKTVSRKKGKKKTLTNSPKTKGKK